MIDYVSHGKEKMIMGSEPRWLIGGPNAPEQVTMPQQAVPKVTKVKTSKVKVEGTYKGRTAEQWRELANRSNRKEQESIDHSDTDGSLSQMAHSLNAREYRLCAELAERDGIWEFNALFTLTGALVPDAVYIRTKQGKWVWRIGSGPDVQWFNESKARDGFRRRKNDSIKGFYVGRIRTRGYVGSTGGGRGSGGMISVGYFVGQCENAPIEIVDNGVGHMNFATQYRD